MVNAIRHRAQIAFGLLLVFAALGGILFGAAGRWDVPMFWAYLGTMVAIFTFFSWTADPDLLKERRKPGPGGKDHALRWNAMLVWVTSVIVAGLDVGRFHWSDTVPRWLQIPSLVLMAAGLSLAGWASRTNRFHSSVARIQRDRGHYVITAGPYQYLRHPTYAAAMTWFPLTAVVLGSWWAVLPTLLAIPLFLRRLFIEEGMLFAELEGYKEYAAKVPWRVLPGVW